MTSTGIHNKHITLCLILVCHGFTCIYLDTVYTILATQPRLVVLYNHTIFSFEADIVKVIVTIIVNIVYASVLTFVLTKIFNSENAMFSKSEQL